ncbi:hypothetical protein, partial [Acidithiobacillus thiooxidans]|uniref:hypothetical protein n=1 Tax=Acidithiobacillus thiooxidans TaxID=930 RepID=UPI001C37E94C
MSKTKSLVFAFLLTFLFSTQVVAGVGHQLSVGEQIRLVNQAKNLMQTFTGKHIFVKNSCVSYLINVNSPFYAGKKTMPLGEAMRARSIIVTPSRESPNLHFGWMYGHTNCVPYIVGNIKKNKAYLSGIQEFGSVAVANIPSAPNVLKVFYKSHYYLNHFLPILESSMARGVIEKKKGMESLATLKYQVRIYNLNNWRACKITGGHRFLHNCPHKTLFLRARESPIILPAAWGLHGTALQQRLQQVWQQADHLDAISTGPVHAARHILIFFDPNCPFCAHLWRSLQP